MGGWVHSFLFVFYCDFYPDYSGSYPAPTPPCGHTWGPTSIGLGRRAITRRNYPGWLPIFFFSSSLFYAIRALRIACRAFQAQAAPSLQAGILAWGVGGAWRSLLTVTPFFPGSPGASVGATRMPPRGAARRLHHIRLEHVC